MRVMEAVWPITGLYLGSGGWFAYGCLRRATASHDTRAVGEAELPEWQGVAVSATHCGAGCTLGDIIGEWVVFAGSLTIAGAALWPTARDQGTYGTACRAGSGRHGSAARARRLRPWVRLG
jgi:hypothetical protein